MTLAVLFPELMLRLKLVPLPWGLRHCVSPLTNHAPSLMASDVSGQSVRARHDTTRCLDAVTEVDSSDILNQSTRRVYLS